MRCSAPATSRGRSMHTRARWSWLAGPPVHLAAQHIWVWVHQGPTCCHTHVHGRVCRHCMTSHVNNATSHATMSQGQKARCDGLVRCGVVVLLHASNSSRIHVMLPMIAAGQARQLGSGQRTRLLKRQTAAAPFTASLLRAWQTAQRRTARPATRGGPLLIPFGNMPAANPACVRNQKCVSWSFPAVCPVRLAADSCAGPTWTAAPCRSKNCSKASSTGRREETTSHAATLPCLTAFQYEGRPHTMQTRCCFTGHV